MSAMLSRIRWHALATVTLFLATGTGCGPSGPAADAPPDLDDLPEIELVEELRIGSVDDPDSGFSYLLGRAHPVTLDSAGHVFVFDSQDRHIRRFDREGRLALRFGGAGEGPGEFRSTWVRLGMMGDTLSALEVSGSGRRLTLFSRAGEVLSATEIRTMSVPFEGIARAVIAPEFLLPDRTFVSGRISTFSMAQDEGPSRLTDSDSVWVPRIRFDLEGRVVDTVGLERRSAQARFGPPPTRPWEAITVGDEMYRIPIPPSDHPLSVPLPDGWLLVHRPTATHPDDGVIRLVRRAFAGDTLFDRTYAYVPQAFSDAAQEALAARESRSRASRAGDQIAVSRFPPGASDDSVEVRAALRRAMDFPTLQPPVQGHWVDDEGRIWLRREELGGADFRWVVLGADGIPAGEVRLPREADPAWSRGDVLWSIEPDRMDIPWLVRYRLEGL